MEDNKVSNKNSLYNKIYKVNSNNKIINKMIVIKNICNN